MKNITVTEHNPAWIEIYEDFSTRLKNLLGNNINAAYHIGSTSIKGLVAKPIIDILLVVPNLIESIEPIRSLGFIFRGENIIPLHLYFKNHDFEYGVNLHIYNPDNPSIELHLCFRDYLRGAPTLVAQYSQLKNKLVADLAKHKKQKIGLTGYNLGKNEFIQKIIKLSNFQGKYLRFCLHHKEWQQYKKIWQEYNDGKELGYDSAKNNSTSYHFVLYAGVNIVATALITDISKFERGISYIYGKETDKQYMYDLLIKWLQLQSKLSKFLDKKSKTSTFRW